MAQKLTAKSLKNAIDKVVAIGLSARAVVKVGVPNTTHHSGLPLPTLAAIHEYGAGQSPERAPFRKTLFKNRVAYKAGLRKAATYAIQHGGSLRGYERLGLKAANDVDRTIVAGLDPANAQSTIDAKGSSKPLIAIGEFRQAITHEVERV